MPSLNDVISAGRTVFLLAMLTGLYVESGPFAAVLVGLLMMKNEDIIPSINHSTRNISVIANYLADKNDDFEVRESKK